MPARSSYYRESTFELLFGGRRVRAAKFFGGPGLSGRDELTYDDLLMVLSSFKRDRDISTLHRGIATGAHGDIIARAARLNAELVIDEKGQLRYYLGGQLHCQRILLGSGGRQGAGRATTRARVRRTAGGS